MEALGDLLRWWQALSGYSRMAYATVSVIVVPVPTDTTDTERTRPPMQFSNPLSLPLPGTTRRRQAEAAQLLESALAGYDYIVGANATFAVGLSEIETTDSPRLSLQLQLRPVSTLPDNWLNNLVIFVLHTVPGLGPTDLLITDSHGEVLYTKGQPTPAAARMISITSTSAIPIPEPKAVFNIPIGIWGLAALVVVALGSLYLLQAHRGNHQAQTSGETAASRPPQLEQFLGELTASQIASLLEGERPEVVGAVLHHVIEPETVAAVGEKMNIAPSSLLEPTRPPREETLVSFTEALHTKLTAN